MAKMTKNQLIDAIAEGTQISKGDVKAVIEQMATVGYKELNESGEFVIPGFVKMSVVNKPATEARSGINPFTKRAHGIRGQASQQVGQGVTPEGCQRRCLRTLFEAAARSWTDGPPADIMRVVGWRHEKVRPASRPGELKGVRLHRARICRCNLLQVSILGSEDCNGACKTPQMDRRRDQAAARTGASQGKSASDGERAWASHRLCQTASSRIGFCFCRKAAVRGRIRFSCGVGARADAWFKPQYCGSYICDSINAIMSFGRGTVARPRL